MGDVPVAFAFSAGLVATINPCGFAMLPAYLSYFMGQRDGAAAGGREPRRADNLARGLVTGAVVSAGFLVVFGVTGALVTAGFRSIIDYVPWVALAIGLVLVALGAAMLFWGLELNLALPHLERAGADRRYRSMFLFGVSYAVASLSCALPVFLAVVGVAQSAPTFVAGVATFVVYGLGMAMLVIVLTLALAMAKDGLLRRMRSLMPYVGRVSGAILLLSGVYITIYWVANLRDPLAARGTTFQSVEQVQGWLSDQLGDRPTLWAITFALVMVATVVYVVASRRRRPAS